MSLISYVITSRRKLCDYKLCVPPSGGSAGLAAAIAAKKLGKEITVVVPQSTGKVVREKLRQEGALVEVHGRVRHV